MSQLISKNVLFLFAGNNTLMARTLYKHEQPFIWIPRQSSIAKARRLCWTLGLDYDWICLVDDDDEFLGLPEVMEVGDASVIYASGERHFSGVPVPWWMKIFKPKILEGYSFPNKNLLDNQMEDFLALRYFRHQKAVSIDPWVAYQGSHWHHNKRVMSFE